MAVFVVAAVALVCGLGGCTPTGETPGRDGASIGPQESTGPTPGDGDVYGDGASSDGLSGGSSGGGDAQTVWPVALIAVDGGATGEAAVSAPGDGAVSGDVRSGAEVDFPVGGETLTVVSVPWSSSRGDLSVDVQLDGSLAVLVGNDFAVGASRPVAADGAALSWLAAVGDDGVTLSVEAPDGADLSGGVGAVVGVGAVDSVSWFQREGGESLAVVPSAWGRAGGLTVAAYGWGDVLAQDAGADVPGMEKQFACHAMGAPGKDSWNLEPWRPDVSLAEFVIARCNP